MISDPLLPGRLYGLRTWRVVDRDGRLLGVISRADAEATMAETRRLARAAARGAVASMAMTGIRSMADSLGLIEESPPEAVMRHGVSEITEKVPPSCGYSFLSVLKQCGQLATTRFGW